MPSRIRPLTYKAIVAVLAATMAGSPAIGQSAKNNMLKWELPNTLSPEGRTMVAAMAATPLPNPEPPLEAQRKFVADLQTRMGAELAKRYDVRVEQSSIGGVPVKIVYPKGSAALGTGPVLLNLHGGGFQLDSGSLTETIPIAALSGIPVVAVLYRPGST